MAVLAALYVLALVAWVGSALTVPDTTPVETYWAALGLHAVLGAAVLWRSRRHLDRRGLVKRLWMPPLLAVPPLGPMTFCLILTGVTWRAARAADDEEEGRRMAETCVRWQRLGAVGVSMGVIWGYLFWANTESRRGGEVWMFSNPLVDLVDPRVIGFGTPLKFAMTAATAYHAWLLVRTLAALREQPRGGGG